MYREKYFGGRKSLRIYTVGVVSNNSGCDTEQRNEGLYYNI